MPRQGKMIRLPDWLHQAISKEADAHGCSIVDAIALKYKAHWPSSKPTVASQAPKVAKPCPSSCHYKRTGKHAYHCSNAARIPSNERSD